MKFFVSAKWEDRAIARWVMSEIAKRGHTITCDWTRHTVPSSAVAIEDIEAVKEADQYVGLFCGDHNYKGALVEMGGCLVQDKLIHIIGDAIDSCIFMWHPLVTKHRHIEDFWEWLDNIEEG